MAFPSGILCDGYVSLIRIMPPNRFIKRKWHLSNIIVDDFFGIVQFNHELCAHDM